MIKVYFFTNSDGELLGFNVQGHSGFGVYESDVVCSAVSSAVYMAANTITEIMNIDSDVSIEEGKMFFRIYKPTSCCRDVLMGLKLHLMTLEEQYPENIKVNYAEV